jgi:hypothetical protein
MLDGFLLLGAFAATLIGFGWLALGMNAHWKQVRRGLPSAGTVLVLRVLGSAALFVSLMLCLSVDHASMASLVWVMLLAAAAMCIAFTLTACPRLLMPLVIWARAKK